MAPFWWIWYHTISVRLVSEVNQTGDSIQGYDLCMNIRISIMVHGCLNETNWPTWWLKHPKTINPWGSSSHVYGKQGTKPPTNCWSISLGGGSIPIENQIALGKAGVFYHTNHHRPFGLAEDAEHHGLDAVVVEGHRLLPYLWSDSIRTHRIGCQAAQSAPCGTLWN